MDSSIVMRLLQVQAPKEPTLQSQPGYTHAVLHHEFSDVSVG